MKKWLIGFLALVLTLLVGCAAAAEAGFQRSGDWCFRILEDGTAEILYHWGFYDDAELPIPDELDGATVSHIDSNFFHFSHVTAFTVSPTHPYFEVVDGVLFSNEYSLPYQPVVDTVTVAAMAVVIGALKEEIRVPFGVHVISDAMATIDLAAATGAAFVRSVFTGGYVGEMGIRSLDIAAVMRRKKALGLEDLLMFYMVGSESDGDLSGRSLTDTARAIVFKCRPTALCVSGKSAGCEASDDAVMEVRAAANGTPVLFNTGVNAGNVQRKLAASDGVMVGTAFKVGGVFEKMVDEARVREFMEKVNETRS